MSKKEYINDPTELSSSTLDKLEILEQNIGLLHLYWSKAQYDESEELIKFSLEIAEKNQYKKELIELYRLRGNLYYIKGDYSNALENYLKCLPLSEEFQDHIQLANVLNNIGSVYMALNENEKALDCLLKSKEHRITAGDYAHIYHTLSNLASIYSNIAAQTDGKKRTELLNLSIKYYLDAYEICEKTNDLKTKGMSIINNLGSLYLDLNELELAHEKFLLAVDLSREANNTKSLLHALEGLSRYYYMTEDFKTALSHSLQALECSKKIKSPQKECLSCESTAKIYFALQDFKNAYYYLKRYSDLKNELFTDQLKNKLAELQTKFEIETKEKEVEIYRLKNVELVQANQEIHEQKVELEKLNEIKNEFLGVVVHDLRNPISCILGICDLFEYKMEKENLSQEYFLNNLALIKSVSDKMLLMVNQLLDISAIESGKISINLNKENFLSIIEIRELYYKSLAEKKNIRFLLDKANANHYVMTDRDRILEVMDNLITNAIKFTLPGGEVNVTFSLQQDHLKVIVTDTGQGLKQEELKDLFVKFRKFSARPTGGESSTGYGLLIIKKILDLHHSNIHVSSEKGKGTTFSFSLILAS